MKRRSQKYLWTVLGLSALFLSGVGSFFHHAISWDYVKLHKHQILYRYQTERIDPEVQVIFVGDSSVGYAVDEELFTRTTGLKTQNLALTGSYGFGAALNMIRWAV